MIVSIIVPTYNEAKNIKNTIKEISRYNPQAEIVIVDDNSPDGTGDIADGLARKNKNITVIHRYKEKGLGYSVIQGLRTARGDIIGVIDADLSHPPKLIPQLLKKFDEGYDFVIGSRYVSGGGVIEWSPTRKIISKTAVLISKTITSVKDPMSGFFFIKKDVIKDIQLNGKSWKILLDILVKGNYSHVVEVPYTFCNRKDGKSKLTLKEYFNYIIHVIQLIKYKINRNFHI